MSDAIVVVGGGVAAAGVVTGYREAGGGAPMTLVSDDVLAPYNRPPLSKKFLRGESEEHDALVHPPEWYAEHDVELRLETHADGVEGRELVLRGGDRIPFDRLVLATGSRPRTFGWPGEDLPGVFTLRSLASSRAIRERVRAGDPAVVVGAGFIGCEVAASLHALGARVSLVAPEEGLYQAFGSRDLSAALNDLYREQGVDLHLGRSIRELRGDGEVEVVVTSEGEELPATLAVLGLGVTPNTALGEAAGAEVDNGIVVDESFQSSVPGIYAVGDVANHPDPVFGRRRRIEHWSHARSTGMLLGRILAGDEARHDDVSSFFSEVFGLGIWVLGDTANADVVRVEGDFRERNAIAYYARDGVLVAATCVGQDADTRDRLKERIRAHESLQ